MDATTTHQTTDDRTTTPPPKHDAIPVIAPKATPTRATPLRTDFSRAADSLEDDNQIGYERERPRKHRRYVPLYRQALYNQLVLIYARLLRIHYQEFRRVIEAYMTGTNNTAESICQFGARALISSWFWDLYVSNQYAVKAISGTAYAQYYSTPQSFILERYDGFLTHLNAIIRPTHIQYTMEDAIYIPLITTTYAWTSTNPFSITDFSLNEACTYAMMDIMERKNSLWNIVPLVSDILGRPAWLLDWHDQSPTQLKATAAYTWFPEESNFSREDLVAAHIVGIAISPTLGPVDVDDWQFYPNGTKPAHVDYSSVRRATARRFTGSTEVQVIEDSSIDFTEIVTGSPTQIGAKRQAIETSTSGGRTTALVPMEMDIPERQQDMNQFMITLKKIDRFRILDYCYYARVILKLNNQKQNAALRVIAFKPSPSG